MGELEIMQGVNPASFGGDDILIHTYMLGCVQHFGESYDPA